MTDSFKNTLGWLLIGTIGVFAAMNWAAASFTGADFLPAGNDSFYHARRILDAWQDPSAFYEFDPRIHVPEGSWITWPWLYDYSLARLLRIIVPPESGRSPMPVLVYFPVFWAYVTVGLVMAIGAALRLPRSLWMLAGLATALLPINQSIEAVGRIDHHYMEYTFVLLTLLGGLRWLDLPDARGRAAFLGFVLGIAPGFHNGLFILQLPVLAALFVLWMRDIVPAPVSIRYFAGFLLAGTLLVVVPSLPFLKGWYVYYLLSQFQLYIAFCTSVLALIIASGPISLKRFALLAVIGLGMLVPILGQVSLAGDFFAHRVARLAIITEARSLISMLQGPGAFYTTASRYSGMVFTIPLVFAGLVVWLFRARRAPAIFFTIFSLFGLVMLVLQFRLHYFGSFALYLPALVGLAALQRRYPARRGLVTLAGVIGFAGAYYLPVQPAVFQSLKPGLDSHYQIVGPLMPELAELCAEDPGITYAWNDVGHYIRYHTECSVIANNFLLTPQHSDKIREIDHLATLDVDEFLAERPDVKYLLVHYPTLLQTQETGVVRLLTPEELAMANESRPLIVQLLTAPNPDEISPRLRFVSQVQLSMDGEEVIVARLFAVRDAGEEGEAPVEETEQAAPDQGSGGAG